MSGRFSEFATFGDGSSREFPKSGGGPPLSKSPPFELHDPINLERGSPLLGWEVEDSRSPGNSAAFWSAAGTAAFCPKHQEVSVNTTQAAGQQNREAKHLVHGTSVRLICRTSITRAPGIFVARSVSRPRPFSSRIVRRRRGRNSFIFDSASGRAMVSWLR